MVLAMTSSASCVIPFSVWPQTGRDIFNDTHDLEIPSLHQKGMRVLSTLIYEGPEVNLVRHTYA